MRIVSTASCPGSGELGTACAYVGMMGSRRRTAMVRERMRELGIAEEEIRRLHAPIGLAIGAETPEEIAVSIFAPDHPGEK